MENSINKIQPKEDVLEIAKSNLWKFINGDKFTYPLLVYRNNKKCKLQNS